MKKILIGFIISLVVIAVLLAISDRPSKAEDDTESAVSEEVSKKLDQVLKGQKAILDGIESLKEELNIVKIRVTQIQ